MRISKYSLLNMPFALLDYNVNSKEGTYFNNLYADL